MSTERDHLPDLHDPQMRPAGTIAAPVAPDAAAERRPAAPSRSSTNGPDSGVVVVPVPSSAPTTQTPTGRAPAATPREVVHVAPNIRQLITAAPAATPREIQVAKERRDLNEIVHGVLILGLAISTALMLLGVGLALFEQRDLPTAVPDIGEVVGRVLALRPSGFLALGLLVLIATPILRVVGSIGAFVYERDWRFAGITTLVLVVLIVSLLLGHG